MSDDPVVAALDRVSEGLAGMQKVGAHIVRSVEESDRRRAASDRKRGRQLRWLNLGGAFLTALFVLYAAGWIFLSLSNREIIQTVECVVSDPTCKLTEGTRERTRANNANLEDNLRCDNRRADAGLPPVSDPITPCRDQTPAEVYASPLCKLPPELNPCRVVE
jgi:hypothetical protein